MKGFKVTLIFGFFALLFLGLVIFNPFKPEKESLLKNKNSSEILGFQIEKVKVMKEGGRWWVLDPRKEWAQKNKVLNFLNLLQHQDLVFVDLKEKLDLHDSVKLHVFLKNKVLNFTFFEQKTVDRRVFIQTDRGMFLGSDEWGRFFSSSWFEKQLRLPDSSPQEISYRFEGKDKVVLSRPKQGWKGFSHELMSYLNSVRPEKLLNLKNELLKSPKMKVELKYDSEKIWKISIFKQIHNQKEKSKKRSSGYFISVSERNSLFQVSPQGFEKLLKKAPYEDL